MRRQYSGREIRTKQLLNLFVVNSGEMVLLGVLEKTGINPSEYVCPVYQIKKAKDVSFSYPDNSVGSNLLNCMIRNISSTISILKSQPHSNW